METYNGSMTRTTDSGRSAAAASRKPSAKTVAKASTRTAGGTATPRAVGRKAKAASPYHHGDLHDALLKAAERILERDGLSGLTLRAVAREAGVSHAAPAHHFGDLTGLLSELAAIGYRRFGAAMMAAGSSGHSLAESGLARGKAYVDFAHTQPAMYQLMFSAERLDMSNPALAMAADASFAGLAQSIGKARHETISEDALTLEQAADIARVWSLVHGFSMLLIDGRLNGILNHLPDGTDAEMLLDTMLRLAVSRIGK
jgi:AcrR family transcriptional regulator